MIPNSIAYKKAFDLAVEIVKVYKNLTEDRKEYVMSKQLLRAGTSIGANLAEANGAISQADFSAKISISYKESLETKYWLDLLNTTHFLEQALYDKLYQKADELSKILFSILKKTRIKQ